MKKFLLAAVTLGLMAVPAVAADLAPVYHAPPAWSWTGFYFGGTVGGGWMNSNSTQSVTSTFCNTTLNGCAANGAGVINVDSTALAGIIPNAYSTTKTGFLAGVDAGYNWQFGQFVVGVETDLSGVDISGSTTASNSVTVVSPPVFPNSTIYAYGTHSEKLDYFGTIRARGGYLVTNTLLAYATGGFAYGDASSSNTLGTSVSNCVCALSPTGESSSSKRAGWTVGGGLEWMFAPNFTVKGEYLYYDFGSVSYAGPTVVNSTFGPPSLPFYGATTAATARFNGGIARLGLNFKL
jgi:outer membrane immunogenic protein